LTTVALSNTLPDRNDARRWVHTPSPFPLHPSVKELLLKHRLHPSTINAYTSSLSKFANFIDFDLSDYCGLPLSAQHTAILNYIAHLQSSAGSTRGSITSFTAAVGWLHRTTLSDQPNPAQSKAVSDLAAAAERSFPDVPIKRRIPFSKSQIKSIALAAYNLSTVGKRPQFYRIFILIILSYKCASRIAELLALTRKHIEFHPGYFIINFPSRKNKKRREASLSFIAGDKDSILCPLQILIDYLTHLRIFHPLTPSPEHTAIWESSFIFPGGLTCISSGLPTNHISYHQVYDQLVEVLTSLNLDVTLFGWHSPRSTGTTVLLDSGMTRESVAIHTGHRDLRSLDSYDQGTILGRLKASSTLSL
jgi:integrase